MSKISRSNIFLLRFAETAAIILLFYAEPRSSRRDSSTSSTYTATLHTFGNRDSSCEVNGNGITPTVVSLIPSGGNNARPVPMEVHRVTLFKDKV